MTGQIPKYGEFFRREDAVWHETLAQRIYVLKEDGRYYLRSDKTSETWWLFCTGQPFAWRDTMGEAMRAMLILADRPMKFPGPFARSAA